MVYFLTWKKNIFTSDNAALIFFNWCVLWERRVPTWGIPAKTGPDMNVRHFQALVPFLVSHVPENAPDWFGLADAKMRTQQPSPGLHSILKYDLYVHL